MMEKDDQRIMFAAFALMGLVAKGMDPATAGQVMWQYAEAALNYEEPKQYE